MPMPKSRTIIASACCLFLGQVLLIARMAGTVWGVLLSDLIQISLGILCMLACVRALRRSHQPAHYHWTWLAVSFGAFSLAQAVGTYSDITADRTWDPVDDVLFFLSIVPIAMLLFLDPDRERSRFDRLHVLDFVQVSCFLASVYLCFANTPSIWLATVGWAGFGWTSSLIFNGVVTLSFLLRALLVKSKAARGFFGGMAAFVFCSGLADSYASFLPNGVQPGHWFDVVWSSLLGIPLTIALIWNPNERLGPQVADRANRIIVSQFFPLLYPFFTLPVLIHDGRRAPVLSSTIAMVSFAAVGVRVLIIQHRLLQAQAALEFDASHDALTRIWNRASIFETLDKEVERQQRSGETLAVLLADIDHFKAVNDTYGHMVGDQVLVEVARRLSASVRAYDSVGRYGGEEFLIVVPACDCADAMVVGERLRCSVTEGSVPTTAGPVPISISVGLVSTTGAALLVNSAMLVRMADQALYAAKEAGRNRVVCLETAGESLETATNDTST